MRKIRGFKLNLRVKEIARRAKKAGVEASEEILNRASAALKPGVLFESFPKSEAAPDQAEAQKLTPMPGLAYSLVLATLGPDFSALNGDKLLRIIEEVALEDTLRFATSLLESEAAQEDCELSPIDLLSESAALELACAKLGAAKIGVSFHDGKLVPSASRACSLSWLAKSKARGKANK